MDEQRRQKAKVFKQFVELLLELADVADYNGGLMECVDAYEREYELLSIIHEYMRCNDTVRTKERAQKVLDKSGYLMRREQQILVELGYSAV